MRLLIHSQGAAEAGLRRYNGRGIFCTIGRKLFSFGQNKVINAEEKKEYPQKLIDTVVNGRPHPIDKNSEKFRKEKTVKAQQKGVKRKLLPTTTAATSKTKTSSSKYIKVKKV